MKIARANFDPLIKDSEVDNQENLQDTEIYRY
jgi:hypothetical protein